MKSKKLINESPHEIGDNNFLPLINTHLQPIFLDYPLKIIPKLYNKL